MEQQKKYLDPVSFDEASNYVRPVALREGRGHSRDLDVVLDPATSRQVRRQCARITTKRAEQKQRRAYGFPPVGRAGPNKAMRKAQPNRIRDSKYVGDYAAAMTSVGRLRRFKDPVSRRGRMLRLA